MQPVLALPAIEYAERSDPGQDPEKQVNEDACGRAETRFGHLCVVCDGMGGHAAGKEAAELALSTVFQTFETAPEEASPAEVLRAAIEEASRRVHVMPTTEVAMGRPGSTIVALLLHAHGTEVAHVGDSRCYLVHEGQIFRVTRDHSMVQELVDRGLLTPEQAAHHPDANRITRALGMAPDVEVEVRAAPVPHVTGDAFVLCSDGLSDLVDDHEILAIVGSEPAAQAVGKLVNLANARGGHDNITVIVLRAREAAVLTPSNLAPTVPQTSPLQTIPAGAGPAASGTAARTVLEPALQAQASVALPSVAMSAAARPLEATAPPPSRLLRTWRRRHPAALAGLVVALVAIVLLGAMLVEEVTERSGKRNATTKPNPLDLLPLDGAAADVTTLAPEPIVVPAQSSPAEPIAPLEPAVKPAVKVRHADPAFPAQRVKSD